MKSFFRFLLLVVFAFTNLNSLLAQWVQTNVPYDGHVYALAVSGTNVFAGTWDAGIFLSTNNGTTWISVSSGLPDTTVRCLAVNGVNLFAGTDAGVFLSTNDGASWTAANSGLTNYVAYSLAVSGTYLSAGTNGGGVFLSTNNGTSWIPVNSGLPTSIVYSVNCLAVSGTNVFAGTSGAGVFRSTNNGTSWTFADAGLYYPVAVYSFAVSGMNLFAGHYMGVFLSTNNGTSWTPVSSGLTNPYVLSFAVNGTNLFAGTYYGGVYLSTNNGTSWTWVNQGLVPPRVYSLAVGGTNLFAGTSSGVWRRPLSEMITSVERLGTDLPLQFSLDQNFPNPFNATTTISFSLASRSFVSLKVYGPLGTEVTNLISEELSAGKYSRQWNAESLPSGVYFYRLQADLFVETKKLLLLK